MGIIEKAKQAAPTREERLRRENEPLRAVIIALREEVANLKAPAHSIEAPQANLSSTMIGHSIGNKGVYFGLWKPKDRNGQTLGKTFHVFAAPTDLDPMDNTGKNCRQFVEAALEIGKRLNWHGHDGIYCENDTALYNALKDGSAIGKWFIPTRDLLHGKDIDGNVVRYNHLYGLQNEGEIKWTFTTEDHSVSNFPNWYWSCTESRDDSARVWNVRFSDGVHDRNSKDIGRLSCRPVRVELAPPPEPTP